MRSLFLLKASFSQSNSSSYFMSTSTVFGHQTSEVTKLFNSFQILSSLIFIVLLSTVDILVILVFFVLILLLYFSDISCSASIITCNPLTVCDTMHSLICKLNRWYQHTSHFDSFLYILQCFVDDILDMLNSNGDKGHPCLTPCPMMQQPASSPSILITAVWPKYNLAIKFLSLQSTPISFNIHIIFHQSTLSNAFS